MSTGISISSINRIKELAEQKKFKEALEILDTQNLDKSINPQFLKISGEIFRENKRYYDSRRILLKAHQMAPQGNRIIYELIQLYLELGYYTKAQKYYEQYMFYTTPEDTQKDYVEYIMKKATGADVKELASILIPILERMPEDRWNFEAILLYHKMDRKDMALEESRYILENFKDSQYVQPVIDYIDDKLDVDEWFNIYPAEEQPEDIELFGELIEQEEKILEADYLRMYPPEAKIMVEAEDHDAIETAPVKEKKPKKRFGKKSKKNEMDEIPTDGVSEAGDKENSSAAEVHKENESESSSTVGPDVVKETSDSSDSGEKTENQIGTEEADRDENTSEEKLSESVDEATEETVSEVSKDEGTVSAEEQMKKEREDALEKILSKKIDKDKIKESAKQVAKAVKEMDTDKAKKQVQTVAETVKDNVKKATSALGDAVGTKPVADAVAEQVVSEEDLILDGIIESVLEPPKKTVGQVVMNEELDALIPDSLEAMSEQEIADIEAKKEEMERLELEALEATLKLEEEKKAKKQGKLKTDDTQEHSVPVATPEDEQESGTAPTQDDVVANQNSHQNETDTNSETEVSAVQETDSVVQADNPESSKKDDEDAFTGVSESSSYSELKSRFIENMEEEKPLESLGFITVVHSDVDSMLEDEMPDTAGILRQMIDNKEFYSGENSLGFESEASYENHGFEVEDYDFDTYRNQQEQPELEMESEEHENIHGSDIEDKPAVQDIFAEESVVAFEDVVLEDDISGATVYGGFTQQDTLKEDMVSEEVSVGIEWQPELGSEPVFQEEEALDELEFIEEIKEPEFQEDMEPEILAFRDEAVQEEPIAPEEMVQEETMEVKRELLRANIVISNKMESLLIELKESR